MPLAAAPSRSRAPAAVDRPSLSPLLHFLFLSLLLLLFLTNLAPAGARRKLLLEFSQTANATLSNIDLDSSAWPVVIDEVLPPSHLCLRAHTPALDTALLARTRLHTHTRTHTHAHTHTHESVRVRVRARRCAPCLKSCQNSDAKRVSGGAPRRLPHRVPRRIPRCIPRRLPHRFPRCILPSPLASPHASPASSVSVAVARPTALSLLSTQEHRASGREVSALGRVWRPWQATAGGAWRQGRRGVLVMGD